MSTVPHSRAVLAALSSERARLTLAHLILGASPKAALENVPAVKRERVREALLAAGVLRAGSSGDTFDPTVFARVLALEAPAARIGIDRFVRDGRIERFPVSPESRAEVLRWAIEQAIHAEERLDEASFTERLAALSDDPVILRRYLVDAGLVVRNRDGRDYRRAGG